MPAAGKKWLWTAVAILVVWGLIGASQGKGGLPPIREGGTSDLVMYRAIATRVAAGESYYPVLASELPARGYAIRPVFNWRLPTLVWLNALPPAHLWGRILLAGVGLLGIMVWLVTLHRTSPRAVPLAVPILLLGTAPLLTMDASVDFYEVWAGLCVAASLAANGMGWWRTSVALGAGGLFIRELVLPYVLIMAAAAWIESRRREAVTWLAAVAAFMAFWAWHLSQVLGVMPEKGLENAWLVGGGWPFVLEASHASIFLMLFPERFEQYLVALLVPLLWAGGWYWANGTGRRVAATLTTYFLCFMIAGRPDNWYWGFIVAPLIPLAGLGYLHGPRKSRRRRSAAPA
ncbi:MAG TPA: hypothetical protein VN700_19835 [Vicinamibacterales bacterium]|nr:hypothetical protein [Vicinamibacterales bacterium]